jgi:hypothetical protein
VSLFRSERARGKEGVLAAILEELRGRRGGRIGERDK